MELKSKLNFWLLLKKTAFTEQNDALILKQDGANTFVKVVASKDMSALCCFFDGCTHLSENKAL